LAQLDCSSSRGEESELGQSLSTLGIQFFHEIQKREMGRLSCLSAKCSHFISLDTDEFYVSHELMRAKEIVSKHQYDVTACRMRLYFRTPFHEYMPLDNFNAVSFITKCTLPLRLATPDYPVLIDPTRRPQGFKRFHLFERHTVEMHHMSFVRLNIERKLLNVSNRANFEQTSASSSSGGGGGSGRALHEFIKAFHQWTPEMGVIHPHPILKKLFTYVRTVPDQFHVNIDLMCFFCTYTSKKRCSRCHRAVYCSKKCQQLDWNEHQKVCKTLNY